MNKNSIAFGAPGIEPLWTFSDKSSKRKRRTTLGCKQCPHTRQRA